MGSKGSQTQTSTSAPNPQAMQLYQNLLTQAQGVAATPYTPYGGQLVAPVNQQQSTGIAGINANANFAAPYIQQAATYANQGAAPLTTAQIQQYMSPYTQNVVNATQAQFNNQNQQQLQSVRGNAIAQGALGGNREAIAESELANQQQLAQAPVIAGLQNQGYQTGLNTALAEQQAAAQGAYSLGNLGVAGQNAALTGANAQVGAGTLQQQTQQAQDAAAYQQFLNQQAYPFQTTQWLAGLGTGVGSQMGGTSATTGPAPNQTAQYLGLGLTAAGMFFDRGGSVKSKGVVPRRDVGGGVNYQTFGGGFGSPVVPYSGGKSWVPTMGITHGGGAPRPPSLPNQQPMDLSKQMQQVGSLANKIDSGTPAFNSTQFSAPELLGSGEYVGPLGYSPQGEKRGGVVSGYADGGTPVSTNYGILPDADFNTRFDATTPVDIPNVPLGDLPGTGFDTAPVTGTSTTIPVAPSQGVAPTTTATPVDAAIQTNPNLPTDTTTPSPVPVAPPTAGVAPASTSLPRGLRNNNPGNIEDGTFARSQPGYKGSDGRFAIFDSPEAGTAAQSNLLRAYGSKGINTLSGIINRWAPAADNNNTAAYISAVSKMTGIDPNQPLDMNDPNVRTKIASAIGQYENGASGVPRDTMLARNYNRAAGIVADNELPASAQPAQYQDDKSQGILPKNLFNLTGMSPEIKHALMAAGLGMMASRSPFLGVAAGEGGLSGLQSYEAEKQREAAAALSQRKIDLEAQGLSQKAQQFAQEMKFKALPYQGAMTAKEQADLAVRKAQLLEAQHQHELALHTPVKWSEDRYGNVTYALPRANPNGGVDFYPIDPNTKQIATTPAGTSPNPLKQGDTTAPSGGPQAVNEGFSPVAQMTLDQAREAAPPPEVRAALPPGSPEARNDAYLAVIAKQNPQYAANLKAIADYQMNPAQLFSLRKNMRANAMGDLFIYDPTYDQRRFNQTNRAITGWAQSPEGRATRSLSVVIEHLGTAEELGQALQNGNVQLLNQLKNTLKTQFGYAGPTNFEAAKQIVADEMTKAVIGGQIAEGDRQGLQRQISQANSPAQLEGAIHTFKELMGGQVIGLQHTYETATGLHNFNSWLTPRAQLEVSKILAERQARLRSQTLPGAPGTGTTPTSAPAATTTPQQKLLPAQRFKQLIQGGMNKQQAYDAMHKEGY